MTAICGGRFNSKLVRLKEEPFNNVESNPSGFNSKLVRLKDTPEPARVNQSPRFNSKLVRLKGHLPPL